MLRYWLLVGLLLSLLTVACGASKDSSRRSGEAQFPEFEKPQDPPEDSETTRLAPESLKLTPLSQPWKLNAMAFDGGAREFSRLRKKFAFPIQFDGWILLGHVEHNYLRCLRGVGQEPTFTLVDDLNGAVVLKAGERTRVQLEKLYAIQLEFSNESLCQNVDIQFGVMYGYAD